MECINEKAHTGYRAGYSGWGGRHSLPGHLPVLRSFLDSGLETGGGLGGFWLWGSGLHWLEKSGDLQARSTNLERGPTGDKMRLALGLSFRREGS